MKKIIPLVLIIAAFAVYFVFKKNSPSSPIISDLPSIINSPYAVENLNQKVNQDTVLTIEKEVAKTSTFTSYLISFTSENLKQYALMYLPVGPKPSTGWPVVIVNHGHIPPKEYSTINSYRNTSAYYASQGFLVLKPDYRGHDQSQGESTPLFSRAQYAVDVLNLVAGIDTLKDADPNKIFMYGHSMGGEISLLVAENTDKIKGITLWAPAVADYPESVVYFLSKRNPTPTNLPQLKNDIQKIVDTIGADKFSSLSYLNKLNIPVLVQHSTTDESVPFSWGENLVTKLKSANKQVTFYSYPNDNHDISKNFSTALKRDVDMFKKD